MMQRWIWGLLALCCLPLLAADLKPQRLPQPGDLEHILQKKELRALVVYERGFFFSIKAPSTAFWSISCRVSSAG